MKIGIIGVNKISIFYAIILSQYGHEVILYSNDHIDNNNEIAKTDNINHLSVDRILLEENFFNTYIKNLPIFKKIDFENIEFTIIEKFFFKEVKLKEKFIEIINYEYIEDFNFLKIPNIEIVSLNSKSINQMKMMEDILILDSIDEDIIKQLDIIKNNNWLSIYIEADKNDKSFQITKEGKYSIFAINNKDKQTIFINTLKRHKQEVLKNVKKITNNYKVIKEESIIKYDKYAYKNIAIVNTGLMEYNYPYRDYSLLVQIIQKTEPKKIFASLDIYSDIKSQVI